MIMLLACPVCHLHYFCLALPLEMALSSGSWEKRQDLSLGRTLRFLLAFSVLGNALPLIVGLEIFRDAGLSMYAALLLWLAAVVALWQRSRLNLEDADLRQVVVVEGSGITHDRDQSVAACHLR